MNKSLLTTKYAGNNIVDLTLRSDGQVVAVSSLEGQVKLWEIGSFMETKKFSPGVQAPEDLSFSFDNQFLAMHGVTSAINIHRVDNGKPEWILEGLVSPYAFSPDGKFIAADNITKGISIISLKNETIIADLPDSTGFSSMAISPDGQLIATGGGYQLTIRRAENGESLCMISAHANPIFGIAFNPDNHLIATAGYDGTARVWSTVDGHLIKEIISTDRGQLVYEVAFSPDGNILAVGNTSDTLSLYQVSDWTQIQEWGGYEERVHSIVFSPDGQLIAAADQDRFRLQRVSNGEILQERFHFTITSLSFSPNGKYVASAGSREVKVWDMTTGNEVFNFGNFKSLVVSVAFSPDENLTVGADADGVIQIWNLDGGSLVHSFLTSTKSQFPENLEDFVFSPDGKLLYTISNDGAIGVWGIRKK